MQILVEYLPTYVTIMIIVVQGYIPLHSVHGYILAHGYIHVHGYILMHCYIFGMVIYLGWLCTWFYTSMVIHEYGYIAVRSLINK